MRLVSDAAGVVTRKGFLPENLRPLAHEVVVPQSLAVLADAVLRAVEEVFGLSVAVRTGNAVQEKVLLLHACRLVFFLVGPHPAV